MGKIKEWKELYCANTNQELNGVATLISAKVELKRKKKQCKR